MLAEEALDVLLSVVIADTTITGSFVIIIQRSYETQGARFPTFT